MPINLTGTQIADTYGQLLHVSDGPTSTSKTVYSGTGTATALKVSTTHVDVDNIRLDGTTISTTTTNGDINLAPNGTGAVIIGNANITGGTISNVTLSSSTLTSLTGGTITGAAISGGSISGTTVTTGSYSSNVNETLMRSVRKASAGTINKGQAVYVVGSTGSHLTVELADASVEATAATTIGVAAEPITNSTTGYMIISGLLTGLNTLPTASFTNGALLWLSETAGALTTTRPTQPAHGVAMGWVVNASNGSAGSAYIKIINGQELDELHDVLITTPATGDILEYDGTVSPPLWKNVAGSSRYLPITGGTVTGSVIIDHTDNTGDALRVTLAAAGSTANAFIVEDSTPDSTPFVVKYNGVGVLGHTNSTPNTTGNASLFQVNGLHSFQSTRWAADAQGCTQHFLKSRSDTIGTQELVLNTDTLGTISFGGSDGVKFLSGAYIRAIVQGTAALDNMPSRLVFGVTYDGQSSPTIALTVSPEGCVEIGNGTGGLDGGAVLRIVRQMTATPGGVSYGAYLSADATAAATSQAIGYFSNFTTAAGAFTLPQLNHFMAGSTNPGAGSAITTIRGFFVSAAMTTGTNNYGFVSQLASATNVWGFFAAGTANNAFNGSTRFGNTAVPTATVDVTGNVAATTTILSSGPTSGIGYATGAGGTVTQGTSRKTGVTLNKTTGAITLFSTTTTANTFDSFTVTNSAVVATDVVIVNFKSGATADSYSLAVTAVAAGSFRVQIHNIVAVAVAEAPVINFAIIKGVTA